jgi:AAA domain
MPADIHFAVSWPRGQKGIDELEKWLDEHPTVRVVGIDILARVKDVGPADGSAYTDDYKTIAAYQQLAQRRDIAIIILHHTRKADGDDPLDLISGTLGIVGAADHVAVITGNSEKGFVFTLRGRDLTNVDWDMQFEWGIWTIVGERMAKKPMDTVDRLDRNKKIRDLHATGATQYEIAKEVGIPRTTVQYVLNETPNPHPE